MAVRTRDYRASGGFTLIELMGTIVIISVLAAIAVPTYRAQVLKGRRVDAKTAVLDLAGREERYYASNNQYTNDQTQLGYPGWPQTVGGGFYQLNQPVIANAGLTFTVTAQAIGTQTADTSCQTFSVDNTGQQTAADNNAANSTSTCWK